MHSFGGFLKDRYFVLVFTTLVAFVAVQVQVVEAAVLPVRLRQALVSPSRFALPTGRSLVDPSPEYSDYQISDGVGGTAKGEAEAIFIAPFEGIELSSIPFEVYDAIRLAEEIASDAEIELFLPALNNAAEWERDALRVGLYKNKVLYQTAALQAMKIKIAKHKAMGIVDPWQEVDLDRVMATYEWVVEEDRANSGKPSLGVA